MSERPAGESGRPATGPGAEKGRERSASLPRHVVNYLKACRAYDTVAGPVLLLVIFILINFPPTLAGLHEFLGLRVTVRNLIYVTGFTVAWRVLCAGWGLYDWRRVRWPGWELGRVAAACTSGSGLALVFPALSVTGAFSHETVIAFWAASILIMGMARLLLRWLILLSDRRPQEVLIVGTGPRGQKLLRSLREDPDLRVTVVGFVDAEPHGELPPDAPYLGSLTTLEATLAGRAVDEVLIALPMRSRYEDVQQTLRVCERVGVRAKYLPDIFQHSRGEYRLDPEDPIPGIVMLMAPDDQRMLLKRWVDVVVGVTALVALSPVMLLAAVAIKLTSPGPVLFVQPRYGLNRRRFNMLKFRTMVDQAEAMQAGLEHLNETGGPTFKIRNDPRVTTVGRWLRITSIDELPQLIHVVLGDMSLVGPRPLPERDVQRFNDASLMRRFSVRPGLTCLWQINGRSELTFDDWFALDLKYIDEWSLALDFRILLQTIPVVLRGRGAV